MAKKKGLEFLRAREDEGLPNLQRGTAEGRQEAAGTAIPNMEAVLVHNKGQGSSGARILFNKGNGSLKKEGRRIAPGPL
ncbi:hypothetical protein ASD54_04415 [Rhizobium sp. Root149]|nr:hypothetical protein ASD54_04415 [Rhizobium sp. Root149]